MSDLKTIAHILDKYGDYGSSDIQLTSDRGAFYVKDKQTRRIREFPYDGKTLLNALIEGVVDGGMERIRTKGQAGASFDEGGKYRGRLAIRKEQGGLSASSRATSPPRKT